MALRKKTLRKMTPKARKVGKLVGELESIATRLKNMLPEIQDMEMWQIAEQRRKEHFGNGKKQGDSFLVLKPEQIDSWIEGDK